MDFGFIELSSYYVNLLIKNGIVVLKDENWAHQGGIGFDRYAVLGPPAELIVKNEISTSEWIVSVVMLPVDALNEEGGRVDSPFLGKLAPHPLESIKGMSGGPIFGFKKYEDGSMKYWIVAIQSSWIKHEQTIKGYKIPIIAECINNYFSALS
ncbi:hypothetical protein [Ancylobacter terrae]|uniref:hypothetical protein n=1 Tax=Ancylobacter sp. sgz301288 TaxID=3342077 RepID=UPI003859AC55